MLQMSERRRMGFVPRPKPSKVEELGLVIASVDPREFVEQLEAARNEVKGSGSERAELDASMIEDLVDDVRAGLNVPIVNQKIVNAVYRSGSQNEVILPDQT